MIFLTWINFQRGFRKQESPPIRGGREDVLKCNTVPAGDWGDKRGLECQNVQDVFHEGWGRGSRGLNSDEDGTD